MFLSGLWAAIKGAKKAGKAIDTGLNLMEMGARGIDALFHTEEEKAHETAEERREFFQHTLKMNDLFNKSNTASSQARRALAYVITGLVSVLCIYGVVIISIGYLWNAGSMDPAQLAARIELYRQLMRDIVSWVNALWIGGAFAAVVTTFFVSHGWFKSRSEGKK